MNVITIHESPFNGGMLGPATPGSGPSASSSVGSLLCDSCVLPTSPSSCASGPVCPRRLASVDFSGSASRGLFPFNPLVQPLRIAIRSESHHDLTDLAIALALQPEGILCPVFSHGSGVFTASLSFLGPDAGPDASRELARPHSLSAAELIIFSTAAGGVASERPAQGGSPAVPSWLDRAIAAGLAMPDWVPLQVLTVDLCIREIPPSVSECLLLDQAHSRGTALASSSSDRISLSRDASVERDLIEVVASCTLTDVVGQLPGDPAPGGASSPGRSSQDPALSSSAPAALVHDSCPAQGPLDGHIPIPEPMSSSVEPVRGFDMATGGSATPGATAAGPRRRGRSFRRGLRHYFRKSADTSGHSSAMGGSGDSRALSPPPPGSAANSTSSRDLLEVDRRLSQLCSRLLQVDPLVPEVATTDRARGGAPGPAGSWSPTADIASTGPGLNLCLWGLALGHPHGVASQQTLVDSDVWDLLSQLLSRVSSPHCRSVAHPLSSPHLTRLSLVQCYLGDRGLEVLMKSMVAGWQWLMFASWINSSPGVEAGSERHLHHRREGRLLEGILQPWPIELDLASNSITPLGCQYLADWLSFPVSIRSLNLESNPLLPEGVTAVVQALWRSRVTSEPSSLEELNLNSTSAGEAVAAVGAMLAHGWPGAAAASPDTHSATATPITGSPRLDEGPSLVPLFNLQRGTLSSGPVHLRVLRLAGCDLHDLSPLAMALRVNQSLEHLDLSQNLGINMASMLDLVEALRQGGCRSLTLLNLEMTDLSDEVANALAELLRFQADQRQATEQPASPVAIAPATELAGDQTPPSDDVPSMPAGRVLASRLRVLNLRHNNRVGFASWASFGRVLAHPANGLESLDLADCSIGCRGLCLLFEKALLAGHQPLQLPDLDLSYNDIGDAGVGALSGFLAALPSHSVLNRIVLRGNRITKLGMDQLLQAVEQVVSRSDPEAPWRAAVNLDSNHIEPKWWGLRHATSPPPGGVTDAAPPSPQAHP
ncbi:hypothetical protein H696_02953 [Fonticula alba]|uniref:Uncharacterized protein n=1 Tax=Fonticula alba TaxID=691883 RepID=A0A058Z8M1_FONAL|nr:hypothetical protein H696_02953 [Fonticula alba]KCV70595.1 hypothetical protein H696_02953 [Fonticula alba]|eukprot:XP_009495111.1 hypothetical protein H696_02953 [Fonticula alba]